MSARSRFFITSIILVVLGLIVTRPSVYMDAALRGGELFLFKVFPALFPFFIITRLLTLLGVGNYLSKVLKKPLKYMYNTSPIGGYIFVLSIISGYPLGAKLIAEFRQNGNISDEDAKRIMPFTSTSGPLFILGTVGLKIIGDYKAGVLILISHLLGAVLNGFVFRGKIYSESSVQTLDNKTVNNFFNDAVTSSITAIMQVAASMIILNVFIVALEQVGAISIISNALVFLGIDEKISSGIVYGFVELTQGIAKISSQGCKIKDIIVPISVIISFGGLSVMIQSMTFLAPIRIKSSYYLVTKISQAMLTFIISSILVLICY